MSAAATIVRRRRRRFFSPFKKRRGKKGKSRLALVLRLLHLLGFCRRRRRLGLAPLCLDAEVVDGPELGLEQGFEL